MKKVVYYVAMSLDGYIAGEEDISGFILEGKGVEQYQRDLQDFRTVVMGRKTYEYGFRFGLRSGDAPYPEMENYVISEHIQLPDKARNLHTIAPKIQNIDDIIENSNGNVYLCGGGILSGWLLKNQRIDQLIIKLNPVTLGQGVKLFENTASNVQWNLTDTAVYEDGMVILRYDRR